VSPLRALVLAVGVAVASLVASGCGQTVIDAGKAQRFITTAVTKQAGVRVKSVVCPKNRKAKKGDHFQCTVTGTDGTKGVVDIVQRDDKGNVHVSAPFLHMREAEASIASQIRKQVAVAVAVTCPEIVVPKTGGTFRCSATDGKDKRPVAVTMTNATGGFSFKVR
jgi:hypothetical protein